MQAIRATPLPFVASFKYLPMSHAMQVVLAVAAWNWPFAHRVQSLAVLLPVVEDNMDVPAAQDTHCDAALLPALTAYLPAAQGMQSVSVGLATLVLYVPAAQLMQPPEAVAVW